MSPSYADTPINRNLTTNQTNK